MHPEDPARLGNYRVARPLRDVPIGRALLGTDQTGRAVVLTVVDPRIAAGDGFRERFAREARAAAVAPPAFVAAVLDVDVAADPPWLATVAVSGPSLEELVGERGPLGDPGTAALAERLAAGLGALHAAGLVHGDLTPTAVVLAEDGPRLVGFGLARAAGRGFGTPGFQAPEQTAAQTPEQTPDRSAEATTVLAPDGPVGPSGGGAAGGGAAGGEAVAETAAVDVFALGAVLVYAATGRSPFAAGDAEATRRRVATAEPDLGAMAEPVRSAVLACLHKEPARRPTTARFAGLLTAPSGGMPGPGAAATVVTAAPSAHPAPTGTLVGAPPIEGGQAIPWGAPAGASGPPPAGTPPYGYGSPGAGPQQPGSPAGPPSYGPPVAQRYGPVGGPPSAPRRRGPLIAAVALAVVVVLALVAGVALLVSRSAGTAAPPSAGADPTAAPTAGPTGPTTSGGASGTPDPGTGGTLVDVAAFGADLPRFTTPSRNISCQLSDTSAAGDGEARCDVAQRTWQLPATPSDCPGAFGTGASVAGAEKGALTCVSDTIAAPGLQVLQYGQALSFGGIVCDSQETGVRCVNHATGHGFRVARASYDLF